MPKALIVDDSRVGRLILEGLLKNLNVDLEINKATDGLESIFLVKKVQYDIIFMDCLMPEMDGLEAIKEIRNIPEYKNTPIIMLRGNDEKVHSERRKKRRMRNSTNLWPQARKCKCSRVLWLTSLMSFCTGPRRIEHRRPSHGIGISSSHS